MSYIKTPGTGIPGPLKRQIDRLRQTALSLGADDAKVIAVNRIPFEDRIIEMCRPPRCELYGQSANCPPHVITPQGARCWIHGFYAALLFKFDVPPGLLFSDEGLGFFRKTFTVAAVIEDICMKEGLTPARGLGAGSCKMVFCRNTPCRALTADGTCRHPDLARPSMEALGINVFRLVRDVGWEIQPILRTSRPGDIPSALLAGLVLVGSGDK